LPQAIPLTQNNKEISLIRRWRGKFFEHTKLYKGGGVLHRLGKIASGRQNDTSPKKTSIFPWLLSPAARDYGITVNLRLRKHQLFLNPEQTMKEQKENMDELILKYLNGELTDAEKAQLDDWMQASPHNRETFKRLTDKTWVAGEIESLYAYDEQQGWNKLQMKMTQAPVVSITGRRAWLKWSAAAAIILILGASSYFIWFTKNEKPGIASKQVSVQNDVAPGRDGAILTLADGRQIVLDNAANGKISEAAEKKGNLVSYEDGQATEVVYNTMSTPRGRQYSLVLADGSKVWLNAASSIRFPTAFVGKERRVEVTGEAYFEVAHDPSKPFIVTSSSLPSGELGWAVQVLGTHFNVNTYEDEGDIKVTLLEGSVNVTKGNASGILKPGQQARIAQTIETVNDADLEEVMAWRNGKFVFGDKVDIETIMKQIARWYDVDVEFEGKVNQHFGGSISRNVNVSQVLKVMEATGGVSFKVEGRKVIVIPKNG
jgi:ferric-dicitrate binding protein FerR (iron transport regulator)